MTMRSFFQLTLIFLLIMIQPNSGCYYGWMPSVGDAGGSNDVVTVHMPFRRGYTSQCTQGVNGSFSHRGDATRNDLDFDTSNDRDEIVFAPVAGIAYVHDDPSNGFGRHVNISLGDGTYILLAHLEEIFIRNETEVGLGQVIAFEGTTGHSDGDHVHMGRHRGDPAHPGDDGDSIDTLAILARDEVDGSVRGRRVIEFACALSGDHRYTSELPDVRSHPDGTLVKSPYGPDVYILGDTRRHMFEDERVFWSHNRNFTDVVLISEEELSCYGDGGAIITQTQIRGAYDGSAIWLLVGTENDPLRYRQQMPESAWLQMLASWGVRAETETDLLNDADVIDAYPRRSGYASWRDGALVREQSFADVYVIAGSVAFPVFSWDVFLRFGYASHEISVIPDGALESTVAHIGNCVVDQFCVDDDFAEGCGLSLFDNFSTQSIPPEGDDVDESEESVGGAQDDGAAQGATDTTVNAGDNGSEPDPAPDPDPDPGAADRAPLTVEWQTPYGITATHITLSGVYAPQGVEQWWTVLAFRANTDRILYVQPDMGSGDYLRFSVEYAMGDAVSWSCLAPFPPGMTQGVATATWNGMSLPVVAAADPTSPGCGLEVLIP